MNVFRAECKRQDIMYKTNDVFTYLKAFESKEEQKPLFCMT